ncbi:hypothetical protein GYMLUDRAFT_54859 [Collybiopsis luxurians FD-317 M1]|nr:hypothetical protein GYMLUDRAFT_54859 [Collybiopsis luxurians FD-317 M1]
MVFISDDEDESANDRKEMVDKLVSLTLTKKCAGSSVQQPADGISNAKINFTEVYYYNPPSYPVTPPASPSKCNPHSALPTPSSCLRLSGKATPTKTPHSRPETLAALLSPTPPAYSTAREHSSQFNAYVVYSGPYAYYYEKQFMVKKQMKDQPNLVFKGFADLQ